ncbi:glutathione S-transferase [Rhizobium sp. BK650]|uniref:hypothetical protein n=1 Tax=Rhizobium sp. BK650 TaxID=2586990 RepID=UPI00160C2237|nr:hypothetical protein [Rhizobium sp. BK650]MBB3657804.1 glutathione S-transferase [Rhizobium sp. BK650]
MRRFRGWSILSVIVSIADTAVWPMVLRFRRRKGDLNDFPDVRRWYLQIATDNR